MAGIIIDRFGKDASLIKKDNDHFAVNVKVAVSPQFLGWIFSLGTGIRIISPERVVDQYKNEINEILKEYT